MYHNDLIIKKHCLYKLEKCIGFWEEQYEVGCCKMALCGTVWSIAHGRVDLTYFAAIVT